MSRDVVLQKGFILREEERILIDDHVDVVDVPIAFFQK